MSTDPLSSEVSRKNSDQTDRGAVHPPEQRAILEDEFGEFPDFDFTILDQGIEQKNEQCDQQVPTTDVVLNREVVRNPRNLDFDSTALSFIKFSRYKVLDIEDDNVNFRKTVSIAEWTEDMINDEKETVKFHRDCHVELSTGTWKNEFAAATLRWKKNTQYPECGKVQLRGQWYYSMLAPGDLIHICSMTGRYRTDAAALPLVLHSHPPAGSDPDDLVLIHHPDNLMTPTVVSETVSCPRRAVFKARNGSSGLTAPSALIGTLRHALFGICMKEQNFETEFAKHHTRKIVRENAEALLGCGVSSREAENQVLETLPIMVDFVKQHTTFRRVSENDPLAPPTAHVHGHIGVNKGMRFAAHATYSVEEPVVSPELALKGFVDAVLETTTLAHDGQRNNSLMALELKTGHNQTSQHAHMGQLSLYTLMLQGRYGVQNEQVTGLDSPIDMDGFRGKPDPEGAAPGGLLVYLNHQGSQATHVAPDLDEFKTLIAQRNVIAAEVEKASAPRGISLRYEDEESSGPRVTLYKPVPPKLPSVQPSVRSCKLCYENHTCMLYASAEILEDDWAGVKRTHGEVLDKFTGHLLPDDLDYFLKWDRLIDFEAHTSVKSIATSWLVDSRKREQDTGESMSCMVYDGAEPKKDSFGIILRFRRGDDPVLRGLEQNGFTRGNHVVISTDGSSLDDSQKPPEFEYENTQMQRKKFRHHMNAVRGYFEGVRSDSVLISTDRDGLERIRNMVQRYKLLSEGSGSSDLKFRIDRDNSAVGVGTLRQNLIRLFTADAAPNSNGEESKAATATQRRLPRLREVVVRLREPTFTIDDEHSLFRGVVNNIPGCGIELLSKEFQSLNQDQRVAVQKVIGAQDYALIQGMPGTGKTSTLSFIARLLAARGKRVLITSYTNTAVDNVVIKLMGSGVHLPNEDGLPCLIRVGPRGSCHENTHALHADVVAANFEQNRHPEGEEAIRFPSAEALQCVLNAARIVCSTVLTVPRSPLLANENFDIVIVDEAGQTSQPAILGALMTADKFVLVGDHKQLPPLVNSEIAQAGGYGESLLSTLAERHPSSVAALTLQYRMNSDICKLSSYMTYGGRLKCGTEAVEFQRLQLPGFPQKLPPTTSEGKGFLPWLKTTVNPEMPVVFVDTDNIDRVRGTSQGESTNPASLEETVSGRNGGTVANSTEATLVRYIITGLISTGLPKSSVGIISPFRAQVGILEGDETLAKWKREGLEISTIDRYQGKDKPVIVISFVRSNPAGKVGRLLQDIRRLNVAITRAKCKLIMVGSFSTLKTGSSALRPVLGRIDRWGQRQLLPANATDCYNIAQD